ncbi:hypothetical protein SAMN05661091_4102 [Paenibacillus uliginis N3/975]|uniref:Uncharacterized protein n=1 Tax=Paenibacillus uliginis N3/975 TaxID=1313296 RepID=A0A1X7HK76_9BACL|nr:hypothetical protein [Paenibacillus uliginis]SMF88079.1 hypothetical protein SAMN05661091_4102 [Paenibacillus uliginis N3/975]
MTKLKVELELDWFDSETGTVSDELRTEVVRGLQDRLINKVEKQVQSTIESKIKEAADKVTSDFLIAIFEEKLQNIKIPYDTGMWRDEVKLLSLSEFVGTQYDKFLERKVFDEYGKRTDREREAKYTVHEYFAKNMLGKELEKKLSELIADARQKAENTVLSTLEKNLREQLSADIINRLNIPSMLKSLQEKAAEIELDGN